MRGWGALARWAPFFDDGGASPGPWSAGSSGLIVATQYNPDVSASSSTTSATFVDVDATNLLVAFTAPSTRVLVVLSAALMDPNNVDYFWGLRDGGGYVTGSGAYMKFSAGVFPRLTSRVLMAVTPGTACSWKWAHRTSAATACGVRYGGDPTVGGFGPALMEVWAA